MLKSKKLEDKTVFLKLKTILKKTQSNLFGAIYSITPNKKLEPALLDDLEERLLIADVGMDATIKIITQLQAAAKRSQINDQQQLCSTLATIMSNMLTPLPQPLMLTDQKTKPFTILLTGVNGAGKTTTAGKLAYYFTKQGYRVMLAATDTFRAAAVEQLQAWGGGIQVPVIAQSRGADPAAVVYDAIHAAQKKAIDIVIADTAGRLHTKENLIQQLKKIHRTISKCDANIAIENMFILDGTTGQNAISQVKLFNKAVNINSIVLTKLDGTAKGGVIFAIAEQTNLPVRFISVGEKIDDLLPFDSNQFINALLEYQ